MRRWAAPGLICPGRDKTACSPRPSSGVVPKREQIATYLGEALPQLGLRGREIDDFLDTWRPERRGLTVIEWGGVVR